jgi:hypothetical protein
LTELATSVVSQLYYPNGAVGDPALPGLEINFVSNRANQRTASLKCCTLINPIDDRIPFQTMSNCSIASEHENIGDVRQ